VPQEHVQGVLARIVDENKKLQNKLSTAENQLQEQARTIDVHLAEARIDPLTELANRRAFNQELARRFAELHRDHHEVSLLVLDIDHFKQFNDSYGHEAGDQVLHQVARVLTATMRESDLVSRYGGEEFAIVLPNTDLVQAVRAAERARLAVEREQIMLNGNAVTVTLSVGVAEALRDDHPRTLFKRADEALYAAKGAGRNRSFVHNGQESLDVSSLPEGSPATPKLAADSTSQEESSAASGDRSHVDALTGLPNRRQLVDEIRKSSAEALATKSCLSLLLLTLDQLPKLRALHGQAQVDEVLRTAAEIICRISEGTVLRFGWEEFAVILPRADIVEANDMDRRLREALAAEIDLPSAITPATVSSGITELVSGDDAATFATRAEAALETSRQAGGNCTHFHCYGARELQEAK
jgi:diguanylate cyclase